MSKSTEFDLETATIPELEEWVANRKRLDEYFGLLRKIKENESQHNYKEVLDYCERSLPLLRDFVRNWKETNEEDFSISSIPAIELGCKFWAVLNDHTHLNRVKTIVDSVPELTEGWGHDVEAGFEMEQTSSDIQAYVREHPGTIQSKLKDLINTPGDVSDVAYWLARLGKLRRVKAGRSYALYVQ